MITTMSIKQFLNSEKQEVIEYSRIEDVIFVKFAKLVISIALLAFALDVAMPTILQVFSNVFIGIENVFPTK